MFKANVGYVGTLQNDSEPGLYFNFIEMTVIYSAMPKSVLLDYKGRHHLHTGKVR